MDRDAALRQASAPKSHTSQYDLDYDRGKVKKMKKKNKTPWHVEENIFQREANVQNAIKVSWEVPTVGRFSCYVGCLELVRESLRLDFYLWKN